VNRKVFDARPETQNAKHIFHRKLTVPGHNPDPDESGEDLIPEKTRFFKNNLQRKTMSEQLISKKLNELNSLTREEYCNPYIPVGILIQEASDLYHCCMKDKDQLINGGLAWSLVEDLPVRAGALQQSQSQWQSVYHNYQQCQEEWKIAAPLAYKLRNELIHYLRHAVRNIPIELAKVRRIAEGNSHADKIQDLSDLAELGKKHATALEALKLDVQKLDEARKKARYLSKLHADVRGIYSETSPLIELRNKAYLHLKEAVHEIREIGQFVFWENRKKQKLYTSAFIRKRKKIKSKDHNKPGTESID